MSAHRDKIPGGLADRLSEKDFPKKKVEEGEKVEREHTTSGPIAREISMDHLKEDPSYYEKLKKMEKLAYRLGQRDALAKFGGSSEAGPHGPPGASSVRDSGSPVATTASQGMRGVQRNIDQGFQANADRGFTSTFTDPGIRNFTLQGGPPTKPFKSDTTGGLRDS